MLQTPVAFFIFNRPELTRQVFAEIARARPRRLLVVADGPRNESEAERCAATRAVVAAVDWECEVLTNFSDLNLGCKRRVSSGISWVFEQCAEAIILEDDCIPHPTFFPFCAELLEKYREDERVPMICGSSFHGERLHTSDSYYFSRFGHIWGWASWRRAWQHYDVRIERWPELRETSWLLDLTGDSKTADYWRMIFDKTYAGEIDTWDYQWLFTWWTQNGLAVVPDTNMISNIGFGDDATHTYTAVGTMAHLPTAGMTFPLRHPRDMVRNRETDLYTFTQICPWAQKQPGFRWWLRRHLPPGLREWVRRYLLAQREKPA
jgi:hypothetical protein